MFALPVVFLLLIQKVYQWTMSRSRSVLRANHTKKKWESTNILQKLMISKKKWCWFFFFFYYYYLYLNTHKHTSWYRYIHYNLYYFSNHNKYNIKYECNPSLLSLPDSTRKSPQTCDRRYFEISPKYLLLISLADQASAMKSSISRQM